MSRTFLKLQPFLPLHRSSYPCILLLLLTSSSRHSIKLPNISFFLHPWGIGINDYKTVMHVSFVHYKISGELLRDRHLLGQWHDHRPYILKNSCESFFGVTCQWHIGGKIPTKLLMHAWNIWWILHEWSLIDITFTNYKLLSIYKF